MYVAMYSAHSGSPQLCVCTYIRINSENFSQKFDVFLSFLSIMSLSGIGKGRPVVPPIFTGNLASPDMTIMYKVFHIISTHR